MSLFRRKADRIIDDAYSEIASAEMDLAHSYTPEDRSRAERNLARAKRVLARAIAARDAWDAREHGDDEEYPYVPSEAEEC